MAKTLQEMLAERTLSSQVRIQKLAEQLLLDNKLDRVLEDIEISQK